MPETGNERSKGLILKRLLPVGLVGAALGIAVAVYVSNNGQVEVPSCAAQPAVAEAVDAAASGEMAAVTATATGRSYADLGFIDGAGRQKTLADFSGRPLLVNFWASWCVPCREEMPALDAVAAHYSEQELSVVAINLDLGDAGVEEARGFIAEEGLSHLGLYADPSFSAFERLKANAVAIGLPATLLLDEQGCEIAVLQGPAEWDSADGYRLLDALIAATADGS